jgi:hypothetical protein
MDARGWSTTGRLRGWHRVAVVVVLCQLLIEIAGIVAGLVLLVWFQHRYRMVVSNIAPSTVEHAADIAGIVAIGFLVCCGVALVRGMTRHPLGGFAQVLLTVRLVGATILVVVSIALLVLLLVFVLAYAGMPTRAAEEEALGGGAGYEAADPGEAGMPAQVPDTTMPLPAPRSGDSQPAAPAGEPLAGEGTAIVGFEWPQFEWRITEPADTDPAGHVDPGHAVVVEGAVATETGPERGDGGYAPPDGPAPERPVPEQRTPRDGGRETTGHDTTGPAAGHADDDAPPAG